MKLFVCIIDNFYTDEVEDRLKKKGYRMTKLASSGGFLKKGNTTFLFGVDETDIDKLSSEIQLTCLKLEQKKQNRNKQAYRYTSFLLPISGIAPFLNES